MRYVLRDKIASVAGRIRVLKNWRDFILAKHGPKIALLRNGVRLYLRDDRSSDFTVLREVAIDDVYRLHTYANPEVIVDVGANIGAFSILAAHYYPHAKIYAFEPEPANFEILKKNIALNKLTNIVPICKAVSSKEGKATFYLSGTANHGMHSLQDFQSKGQKIEVETTTLNSLGHIDILKLDCEGGEYEILENGVNARRILMELHDSGDKSALLRKLKVPQNEYDYYDFILTAP
jgi:FkbM family methyltransferase